MMTEEIKQAIKDVVRWSQDRFDPTWGEDGPKVDQICSLWETNKAELYKLFGNELIVECGEYEFELDNDAKDRRRQSIVQDLEWAGHYCAASFIQGLPIEDFYGNRTSQKIELSGRTESYIPVGMKVSKALKFFIDNEGALRHYQDRISNLIQANSFSGILCLSIHPLDYLSSSENMSNWRSCHALDGEYAAGNLSYMTDPSTIICYLKSKEPVQLDNFPQDLLWNNKKWRMLLHVSPGKHSVCVAGREYPIHLPGARDAVKEVFDTLRQNNQFGNNIDSKYHCYSPWTDTSVVAGLDNHGGQVPFNKSYRIIKGCIVAMDNLVIPSKDHLHYSDATISHIYPYPHICWDQSYRYTNYIPTIPTGNPEKLRCVACGDSYIDRPDSMLCDCCRCDYCDDMEEPWQDDSVWYCEFCDRAVNTDFDEGYWSPDDNTFLCPTCFNRYYTLCVECGRWINKNMEEYYFNDTEETICSDCYNQHQRREENG